MVKHVGKIPKTLIKSIGKEIGIASFRKEAITTIINYTEDYIKYLMTESYEFTKHSKRRQLTDEDVNAALRRTV
jgi:histone H3/H4